MYKQFKDVKNIKFPVYPIPSSDWYRQDGMLFIDDGRVLDDTNMPGVTLGIRRIQCGRTDLCKLKRAYPDFQSMLQSKRKNFIDSNGVPFIYKRTINSPLVHHAIKSIEPKDDHCIIWFRNLPYPLNVPRPPYGDPHWARLLYFGGSPWLIYDFVSSRGKDSFRRV
jgi:hypothetical protein